MGTGKQYDEEFKKQAIKLAKEIGTKAAADELCIPKGTLGTWVQKARIGEIDTGAGISSPFHLCPLFHIKCDLLLFYLFVLSHSSFAPFIFCSILLVPLDRGLVLRVTGSLNSQTGGLRPNGLRESGEYAPLSILAYSSHKKSVKITDHTFIQPVWADVANKFDRCVCSRNF